MTEADTIRIGAPSAAEVLYRSVGWHEVGSVPGYALMTGGTPASATFYWKDLR